MPTKRPLGIRIEGGSSGFESARALRTEAGPHAFPSEKILIIHVWERPERCRLMNVVVYSGHLVVGKGHDRSAAKKKRKEK